MAEPFDPNTFNPTEPIAFGSVLTVKEYLAAVADGWLIDYDGFGYAATLTRYDKNRVINPSSGGLDIPRGVTHVCWFNR